MKESNATGVSVAPKDIPIQKLDSECVLQAQREVKMDRLYPQGKGVLVWIIHWVLFLY